MNSTENACELLEQAQQMLGRGGARARILQAINLLSEGQCICAELYGENPECHEHGKGSIWAKQNPDTAKLIEQSMLAAEFAKALRDIAYLRPAGNARTATGTRALIEMAEAIAIRALNKANGVHHG